MTPRPSRPSKAHHAFTLVELILVLAITAIVMAVAAPMLSRSLRDRHLDQQGLRLIAATELCRSLAISTGVPMVFWIDQGQGRYGIEPKEGFTADAAATLEFALGEDVWFDQVGQASGKTGPASSETSVEFAPDGTPETIGVETARLTDKFGGTVMVALSEDGWAFEIVKEGE
jgi:type II secretion system protein H